MSAQVRLGVIGCGVIGRMHLKVASQADHFQVTAVADVNNENAQAAAQAYRVPSAYKDGYALIDDPSVNAVVLALPTCDRLELALYALEKGKHVLIEKPTGMNFKEVETIMRARGELVAASCASRFRFLESAKSLTAFIETGALGQLRSIRYRLIKPAADKPEDPPYWRFNRQVNGGGIMANWGTYDLDFLFAITGWRLKPREISAQTWTVPALFQEHTAEGSDAETHVSAFIRCEGGTVIGLERGECIASEADEVWEIIGTKGSLRFQMLPKDNKEIWFHEADSGSGVRSKRIWHGSESWDTIHTSLMHDFADAILENRPPKGTLEEAVFVQALIDAIYLSSESAAAVSWERVKPSC